MSVNLMVPKRKLAYSLSIKNKHLKQNFQMDLIKDEAKWNSKWIG
jgi:hypothetical protein